MSQKELVKEKLKKGEWVDVPWAINHYITRLGAIVFTLRKEGYSILSEKVPGKSYQRYRLLSEDLVLSSNRNVSPKEVSEAPPQLSYRPEHQRIGMPLREDSREKVGQGNRDREEVSQQNLGL